MSPVDPIEAVSKATPAAEWREKGEPDPHGNRYACERATLTLGHLTDDELANGAYMNYDAPLNVDAILRKDPNYHSSIVWMTAVKDRIRWLSRQTVALISERDAALARVADTLCLDLQRKCVDMGVYWRAPDAHGVTLNIEQATDLLRDALGVEVEIRAAIESAPNTRDAGPSPFSGRTTRREQ